jgi:hypothetical protein
MSVPTSLEPRPTPTRAQPDRRAITARLHALRRSVRAHLLLAGLLRMAALVVLLCAACLLVDRAVRFERPLRIALASAAALGVLLAAWRWLIAPLRLRIDNLDLAEIVDRRWSGLGQRITDVLLLPDLLATPEYASPSLVRQAVAYHERALAQVDLGELIDRRRQRRHVWALLAIALVPAISIGIWPAAAQLWARRWLLGHDVRWPQSTYLTLSGLGDHAGMITPQGEGLVLQVSARPEFAPVERGWLLTGRAAPLVVESAERPTSAVPDQVSIVCRSASGATKQGNFTRFDEAEFRYELPPLVEPIEVEIRGGDDWFGPVRIEPVERPAVARLLLVARPPGGTADEPHQVGSADDVLLFLPQTELELRLTASQPLRSAEFTRKDQPPAALERAADGTWRAHWSMQEAETLELRLLAEESGLTSKPYFVTLGLLHDREPRLTLRSSGVGRRVTPQARIPLAMHAVDDFGLASIGLELERTELSGDKSQTTSSRWELENFTAESGQSLPLAADRASLVPLAEKSLAPGQAIRLRARAEDRCALEAHTGYSRWLGFQIVTPEELFYEILMRQREQRAKFAAATVAAQSQAESLAKLSAVDGVAALVRAHQATSRQVWQTANQLDATLEELTLNDLGSAAARQLLADNVIKPLRELHNGALVQMRGRLDELAAGDAIDEVQRSGGEKLQHEIVESMQRILAQMSQWESFVDVINQLRQVIKLQNQLRDNTQQVQTKQAAELFDE